MRIYEHSMYFVGSAFRRAIYDQRFPWQYWVKLAYNDALTFSGSAGGVRGSWRHN